MSNPIVSIIVPVFNVERYLIQCLDSLSRQTLSDIEVICLDDGSTDSSSLLLDEYAAKDSRFRVYHRENCGVAETRNVGIGLASGEFVMFVDSDDYIAERTCEVLVSSAKENGADIVVFGGKSFPTLPWADDSFACRDKIYHSGVDALLYERGSIPLMCNKMYRTSFIKDNGLSFNRELTLGEDHAFQFIAFPLAKTVAFTREMLYFYRIRRDSAVGASRDDGSKQLYLHFDVVKYALNTLRERGLLLEYGKEGVVWAVNFLFNSAKKTYHDDRVRFARMLTDFFGEVFEGRPVERFDINDEVRAQLAYLISPRSNDEEPAISIFVECADESDEAKDALDSIEFQDEQSFEVLFAAPVKADSPYAHSIADFIEHDSRARIVSATDPSGVLAEARGKYFIRTYANVVYEPQTFFQTLQLAGDRQGRVALERKAFDVATFGDSADLLGVRDFFDFSEPSTADPVELDGAYRASEFGSHLLSFSGVAAANKVFKTAFLRDCLMPRPCSTWLALECLSLSVAEKIVPTKRPLASLRCFSFSRKDDPFVRLLIEEAFASFDEVHSVIDDQRLLDGFDSAVARYLVLFVDLTRNPLARLHCFEIARDRGRVYLERALCGDQLSDKERLSCEALLSLSYDDYAQHRDAELLGDIIKRNEENLLAANVQAERVIQLGFDIEDFYQSISYRTGRVVTALPRKAAQLAKRMIHAVHRK